MMGMYVCLYDDDDDDDDNVGNDDEHSVDNDDTNDLSINYSKSLPLIKSYYD